MTAIKVAPPPPATGAAFLKFLPRTADDYATVAAAAIVTLDPDGIRCREARIALGSVGVTPLRARSAEALLAGEGLSESVLRDANAQLEQKVKERTADLARSEREVRELVNAELTERLSLLEVAHVVGLFNYLTRLADGFGLRLDAATSEAAQSGVALPLS